MRDSSKAPALSAGLKLIEMMAESRVPQGLSELARLTGTNKNMAGRLLSALQEQGWVEASEPGPRYRLTLKPLVTTSKMVGTLPLTEAARAPLQALWRKSGQSVYLGVLRNDKVVYLIHFDATGPVKVAGCVGGEYPLYCAAPGKVLLAHLGNERVVQVSEAGLDKRTANTITREKVLRKELALTRERGYAVDNEEFGRGIICLAAPVFDAAGAIAGAIGMSTTTIDYTITTLQEKHLAAVCACAREISIKLGFSQ